MPAMPIYTYTAGDRTPFTYYIKWSSLGISYYGCRYSKGCRPEDLWVRYFTSSKYVREFVETYGKPDIIKVTKTFNSIESCRCWESKFLVRVSSKANPKLLNRANDNSYGRSLNKNLNLPGNSGPRGITEHMMKGMCHQLGIEYSNKTEPLSGRLWVNYKNVINLFFYDEQEREDFLLWNKNWNKGRNDVESRRKLSIKLRGVKKPERTEEHRKRISLSTKGKNKPNSGPKNKKWFNNGKESSFFEEGTQPEGWVPGRTKFR